MYKRTTIPLPSVEKLAAIAESENLDIPEETLKVFQDKFGNIAKTLQQLDDFEIPHLPVLYDRKAGKTYRRAQEENKYNAWCYRCDIQGASQGKLKGRKLAVKENIQIAGVPLANGSRLYEGFVPQEDASVVTRILNAGGHIIGTTNVEELCLSGNSFTGLHGPVLNPHDPSRSSGGSSCGSGVVVANGEADMALGCDQGGSVRIPSSWCGIVGLKPTHGLVPYTGIISMDPIIDHCGPMAKTVHDCALLLEVIAGYDSGRDPRQPRDLVVPEYTNFLQLNAVKGKKVGFVQEGFTGCEENVTDVINASRRYFEHAGIIVEDVSIPMHKAGPTIVRAISVFGMAANLTGVAYGQKGYKSVPMVDFISTTLRSRAKESSENIQLNHIQAKYLEEVGATRYYAKACNLLPRLVKAYDDALEKYDVLVMPTLPYVAPKLPEHKPSLEDYGPMCGAMLKHTAPLNASGHPALTINAGFVDGKLPVGLSIIGKHFDEQTVLQLVRSVHTTVINWRSLKNVIKK